MDTKKKYKLITATVVIITVALMAAIVLAIYLTNTGAISNDALLIFSSLTSSAMFLVVIIYALYVNKDRPSHEYEEYRKLVEEKDKENRE